jgi:DNA mismatch repair protein MutL
MTRIRLLPDHVANQIAAGEVVERPASVVKELVENSLDAQATRVTVEIQAGGRSLVKVTDDGVGMNRDDALLSLERHATSKIQRAEDLAAIATMGFRGEALPSIASVSKFTLTTRERVGVPASVGLDTLKRELQPVEGTQIIIHGGKMLEVKAAGCAPGTTIEVRQIFFNLPARRKFLRTDETEAAHVQHYLTLAAMAYPEVGFTFLKDGRLAWQLPAIKSGAEISERLPALRERLRALYGGEQKLLAVNFTGALTPSSEPDETESFETATVVPATINNQQSTLRLWGFIGAPGVARSTREDQHLFVNRRPVENRGLNFALMEGYHTALMKGRYPVCCLFLEIDPAAVDVNIHPAKREVKFHREREVRQLTAQAVRETLLKFHQGETESKVQSPRSKVFAASIESVRQDFHVSPRPQSSTPSLPKFPLPVQHALDPAAPAAEQPSLKMGFASATPRPTLAPAVPTLPSTLAPLTSAAVPLLSVPLRVVGVVGKLYVVLESDRGLVLLDQHAAHERILFEQMLARLEQKQQADSQKLLLPETVELSVRDSNFIREQLPTLTRLGVGLSEFGERTFLLDALPPFVKVSDARKFVLELVDALKAAGQDVNALRLGENTVAKTVCRHAVKANDPLAGPELENLVLDLRHCAMPYTCPHGRPTLIEMNFRELEKKFGRTQ